MSTEDEIRERLAATGIDSDKWGNMGGTTAQHPKFALDMAGNMKKLAVMLEAVVGDKQGEVRLLEEKLVRLKFGGGS